MEICQNETKVKERRNETNVVRKDEELVYSELVKYK